MIDSFTFHPSRRAVLEGSTAALATLTMCTPVAAARDAPAAPIPSTLGFTTPLRLTVNGTERALSLDPRTTLLDALREHLHLTGSKKGCDHGQCGACTVIVEGRRINSCLSLAVMHDGDEVTTVEGLAAGDELHPMQAAFLAHDGFQCGYCTPGQICSAVAMLKEAEAGWPSHVSGDYETGMTLTDVDIRERMSGNLCRCAAYPNIVAAIRDASAGGVL